MRKITLVLFGDFQGDRGKVSGKSLREIYLTLCRRLSVGGDRTLTAAERWENGYPVGATVCASLYEQRSFIKSTDGRILEP